MLRGVFQRAAVAILLMGGLLAPNGICLQQTHKATHSCCAPAPESSATVKSDCCAARAPLPAVVVAPNLPGPVSMAAAPEFVPATELFSPGDFLAAAVIPPLSPPTGAFNLRI
ncbi:MAG: hypothetical protein ABSE87_13415 [Terracidiphilus sp.]|jgi:hypothetical protein